MNQVDGVCVRLGQLRDVGRDPPGSAWILAVFSWFPSQFVDRVVSGTWRYRQGGWVASLFVLRFLPSVCSMMRQFVPLAGHSMLRAKNWGMRDSLMSCRKSWSKGSSRLPAEANATRRSYEMLPWLAWETLKTRPWMEMRRLERRRKPLNGHCGGKVRLHGRGNPSPPLRPPSPAIYHSPCFSQRVMNHARQSSHRPYSRVPEWRDGHERALLKESAACEFR